MRGITALTISAYGAMGIILLLVTHGFWYERAKGFGLVSPMNLAFEPTMLNCLLFSLPLGIGVFIVVLGIMLKNDISQESILHDTLFPVMSFLTLVLGGILGSYLIPLAFNWVQLLGSVLLGGLTAVAHSQSFQSARSQKTIEQETKNVKKPKHPEVLSKWLELEHEFCQSTLQWIVWGTIIFMTTSLIGYYLSPERAKIEDQLLGTSIIHALVIGSWGCIGVYLGIMAPIMRRMDFLRRKIRELALQ